MSIFRSYRTDDPFRTNIEFPKFHSFLVDVINILNLYGKNSRGSKIDSQFTLIFLLSHNCSGMQET